MFRGDRSGGRADGFAAAAVAAAIFVVGGTPDDPLCSTVKRGAEDAGGSVTWFAPQNCDKLGVDAAELIRQAVGQGADAIVAPDWVPEAMGPAFGALRAAAISPART